MQEAILFTIFYFGGLVGLTLMHVAGKIVGFFIKRYKAACAMVDKLEAENRELRCQITFYENERQIAPNE